MTLFTTAYAGSGKLDEKLVADHLNNLLPAELGFVFIPDGEIPPRRLVGLHRVVAWLESEVGKEGTIPVSDLVAALVARRDGGVAFEGADEYEGGDDVALVMVYDPAVEADVELAKLAHAAGIRVIDLTHAADDIVFEDEPEDRETPALDETLAETPPWEADEPTPAEAAAAAAEAELDGGAERIAAVSPAAAVATARDKGIAAALAAEQTAADARSAALAAPSGVQLTVTLDQATIDALADAIVAAMGRQAEVQLATVTSIAPLGSVSADAPSTQPAGTKAYYYKELPDGGGSYRPARGVPKVAEGERKVYLTKEQEAEARSKGMLK